MSQLLEKINEQGCSTENLNSVLKENFSGMPLAHEAKTLQQRRYSETIKQFSQTLYFYSPKA